jgi:acylphosphatase
VRIRRRLIVHGRVHGVGFRVSVARRAESHGVAGWARNRADGTVEIVAEGDDDAVDAIVRFAQEGPRAASVTHVEVTDEEPEGLTRFAIR